MNVADDEPIDIQRNNPGQVVEMATVREVFSGGLVQPEIQIGHGRLTSVDTGQVLEMRASFRRDGVMMVRVNGRSHEGGREFSVSIDDVVAAVQRRFTAEHNIELAALERHPPERCKSTPVFIGRTAKKLEGGQPNQLAITCSACGAQITLSVGRIHA